MFKKGFTFLEVIIVVAIIFIMTAIMLSMAYGGRDKKEISSIARHVIASVRETQNNALTGKQKENDKLPCAFRLEFTGNSYQVKYQSRGIDEDCASGWSNFFDPINLPSKANFEIYIYGGSGWEGPLSGARTIDFDVPYGLVTIDGDSNYKGMEIDIVENGKRYVICVHSTGLVEELGIKDSAKTCAF